jgi:hypothetical protein
VFDVSRLAAILAAGADGDKEAVKRHLSEIEDLEAAELIAELLRTLIQAEEHRRRFDGEV